MPTSDSENALAEELESVQGLVSPAFHGILTALSEARAQVIKLRAERDELKRLLTAAEGALAYLRHNHQTEVEPEPHAGSFVLKSQHQKTGLILP